MPSPKKIPPVRLAIIGTGGMAGNHAKRFLEIPGCILVAAVDISPERVAAFATTHGIPNTFASVAELLAWNQFDAVSIVTPTPSTPRSRSNASRPANTSSAKNPSRLTTPTR